MIIKMNKINIFTYQLLKMHAGQSTLQGWLL